MCSKVLSETAGVLFTLLQTYVGVVQDLMAKSSAGLMLFALPSDNGTEGTKTLKSWARAT